MIFNTIKHYQTFSRRISRVFYTYHSIISSLLKRFYIWSRINVKSFKSNS